MKHLSGFPICNISHAAGIDQIDIRLFTKWHDLIAMLFQNFLHRFCFICIYLAAKIVQCRFFHNIPPAWLFIFSQLLIDFLVPSI